MDTSVGLQSDSSLTNCGSIILNVYKRTRYFVFQTMHTETINELVLVQHYFNLLFTTNFGINFALYCVSGQNFRRALVSLFCPRLRKRSDTTQFTGQYRYNTYPLPNLILRDNRKINTYKFNTSTEFTLKNSISNLTLLNSLLK